MARLRTKLWVAGLVLAGAVCYLAYAGIKAGGSYYMQVDAFVADTSYHDQRVRLHGKVGADDLTIDRDKLDASFQLLGETKEVPVAYHGVLPDLFKADCDVVVEGRLGPEGVFKADHLLTKCASKYEEMGRRGENAS